jgi:2-haloacid dehalogenase
MGRYRDFWELTQEALDFALRAVPDSNQSAKRDLLDAYMTLDCYGEVKAVLAKLKQNGAKTAILSNGTPQMLESAVKSAGLDDVLDISLSVDAIGIFKTSPSTYELVTDYFKCERAEVSFQSSNRWDIAGARAFGFDCAWINRTGQPDEYPDLAPSRILTDLKGLL